MTEIEALVGELPLAAGLYAFWRGSNLARLNWRLEGFTARLAAKEGVVTFTRRRV